jgi:hypothetical protein
MRKLLFILLLPLISCTSVKPPPPVEVVSIPYNASQPRYAVVLERFSFVADLDQDAESRICTAFLRGKSSMTMSDVEQLNGCRAEMACFPVPAEGYMPARNIIIYSGAKLVPGFRPEDLKAQLTSALGGIGNITIRQPGATATDAAKGPYRIVVLLTEFNVSSDKNSTGFGGMGVGPLSLLQLVSVEKSQATGFVRLDIRILDSESERILKAFSVAGSATDAYVSETLLKGSISESTSFFPLMMQQATRAALNAGAKRLYQELGTL